MWHDKTVSVVFPTFNEKDSIRSAIEDFRSSGFVDEVIVVNNNAALGTDEQVPPGAVAPGVGGSVTIANDGRYGDLSGKTVALEPATGFSFDSPAIPRIR